MLDTTIPQVQVNMNAESQPLIVSLIEAAKMLGSCKRTIERERDRGRLKCLRLGRHWKVRITEIHAYLRRLETDCAK